MLNTFRARANCETETKFVHERIVSVERTVAELCHIFAQYSRKAARLRDKGDELAKITLGHAETENVNKSLSMALENFADCISMMSSYGDLRVQNLENKVIKEFGRYEDICKHAKDEVKQIYAVREREINRRRQLDRIKERNPRNRQQIIQAETELVKASADFSKTLHNLEEKSIEFEKQKLHDMKSILLDFISIEIGYHAKALEVLTNAYKAVNSIDEESDLQEFKKSLRVPDTSKQSRSRGLFRSANSLGSLGILFSNHNKRAPGIPTGLSKSEETLDSLKHPISDTEEESASDTADISENLSETEEPSTPVRKTRK